MSANATLNEATVTVTWTLPAWLSDVDHYAILRGSTPETLHIQATVEDAQTYEENLAPGETWYRVQAMDAEGEVLAQSPAVHVMPQE